MLRYLTTIVTNNIAFIIERFEYFVKYLEQFFLHKMYFQKD